MYNQIARIINRDAIPDRIKMEGRLIQSELDTKEGREKARKFIVKWLGTWR